MPSPRTLVLTRHPEPYGASLRAVLPPDAPGRWCRVSLSLPDGARSLPNGARSLPAGARAGHRQATVWWAKLELEDRARGQIVREVFLGPVRRYAGRATRSTLVHIPGEARELTLGLFGAIPGEPAVAIAMLSRAGTALALLRQGWRQIPFALRGAPEGAVGRLRAILGQAPARAGEVPPYETWIALFEPPPSRRAPATGGDSGRDSGRASGGDSGRASGGDSGRASDRDSGRASGRDDGRDIGANVTRAGGPVAGFEDAAPGRAETASAAATQAVGPWDARVVIVQGGAAATRASLNSAAAQLPGPLPAEIVSNIDAIGCSPGSWVILLQAGEILSPCAAAAFARAARDAPWADFLTADCDALAPDGSRENPFLKPGPDEILLRSGLPVRGACAMRWLAIPATVPLQAHSMRLWRALQNAGGVAHVPQILSHVRWDTICPDPITQLPNDPGGPGEMPEVTILIPTAARSPHVLRCLRAVLRHTGSERYRVRLVVSGPGRASILRRAARLPRVSIVHAEDAPFNYAKVNNQAAAGVETGLLLLMNDDVAPIDPGWLNAMVRHMRDPAVGIVGARLLYGNGMVQHEGVILGLANLCEHAGRLRPGADPGLHGLALFDRQVSAVTAACLLIRTALYQSLGGMDEAYAVALNDVDLCLRARKAGWRVVYCAQACLHHYESLSLGRHYSGARAALESTEVRRLRTRFATAIAADPFYNPQASLQPGREWQPAFPPRRHPAVIGVSAAATNPAATT